MQLLNSAKPLQASIVIGSFGSTKGLNTKVFDIEVKIDPNSAPARPEKPLRYGKLPEIRHTFRPDPKSPPKIISLFFVLAVLATLPALFIGVRCPRFRTIRCLLAEDESSAYTDHFTAQWLALGANLDHLSKALSAAPLSHAAFFGSIIAMEWVFFMYYSYWNLFTALPVMGVVSVVTFLSGSKALGEVQDRRLAGER